MSRVWCIMTDTRAILRLAFISLAAASIPSCGGPSANCESLEDLGLALNNYKDTHGVFPPPVVFDRDGRRMHSWRVLTLPYLQATAFYGAYDLESPWDGPANAKLAAGGVVNERLAERTEYASPNSKAYPAEAKRAYKARPDDVAAGDFTTDFLMVVGGDEPLVPSDGPTVRPEGKERLVAAADEVLIVQVKKSVVHWTEPRDVVLTSPAPGWGIPLDAVKEDILGSVLVSGGRATCRDREATLKSLADLRSKANAGRPEKSR